LLQISVEEKKLNIDTKWSEFVSEIKDREEYLNMLGQEGSTPLELFQDKKYELKKDYKKVKKIFKEIITKNKIEIKYHISFEEFDNLISGYREGKIISIDMKKLLYEHIKKKLEEKEIIHNQHSNNIANKLYSYLQRKKLILRDDCLFDEAYEKIKKLKKFENLSENNVKDGYDILKKLIKEKPIIYDDNNNNDNKSEKEKDKDIDERKKENENSKEKKEENIKDI
jgi:pre-mRNA-processing factor 40